MSRIECKNCGRQATLWLCQHCIDELRDMLRGLAQGRRKPDGTHHPGWLDYLHDSATGQTRLGETGRRTPRYLDHLDGEAELASQIELLPGELWETIEGPALKGESWPLKIPADTDIDLTRARHNRERRALQRALGTAKINLRATETLEYTRSVLLEWARDIGALIPTRNTNTLALWLSRNVSAIANDENAYVCYREIAQIITDIEHIINRPETLRYCGPCPTLREWGTCDTGLHAKRGVAHVQCWKCHTTHSVDDLIARGLETVDELLYSAEEVREMFAGIGQPIPDRTWRRWRAEDRLIVRGYRDGKPAYWTSDVKELLELLERKPQKTTCVS